MSWTKCPLGSCTAQKFASWTSSGFRQSVLLCAWIFRSGVIDWRLYSCCWHAWTLQDGDFEKGDLFRHVLLQTYIWDTLYKRTWWTELGIRKQLCPGLDHARALRAFCRTNFNLFSCANSIYVSWNCSPFHACWSEVFSSPILLLSVLAERAKKKKKLHLELTTWHFYGLKVMPSFSSSSEELPMPTPAQGPLPVERDRVLAELQQLSNILSCLHKLRHCCPL